jgi:hypothetical protein
MTHAQTRKDFLKLGAVSPFSFLLGNYSSSEHPAIAQTPSTTHLNVAIASLIT